MSCPGCGLGSSKDCDNPGRTHFKHCGCGGVHDHGASEKCIPMFYTPWKVPV